MAGKNPWGGSGKSGDGSDGPGDDGVGSSGGESAGEGTGGGDGSGDSGGPRNPWLPGVSEPGKRRSASIEDIFKGRSPEGQRRSGGGGGSRGPTFRLPERPGGKSWAPVIIGGVALAWVAITSVHFVQPGEQAVVTWLGGKYSHSLDSGTNFTAPFPLQMVEKENVTKVRLEKVPDGNAEKLILTGDQNLVDLSYLIRWNISDLALYKYQLGDPRNALLEIGEAAMRAAVARQKLDEVLTGEGRAEVEQDVRAAMQARLDAYRSGISVQGIEINKVDPPSRVEEAFKDVSSAQQDADAAINRSRAVAQQLLARAQGDASEFNDIYEEYKLAPEVTRRRLYYETMESILSKTDKTIVQSGNVVPYLPLPEVKARSKAQPPRPQGE
ncbi:MAG: protease modulator HflK [Erythrobacter sp.]|jgi:membrane protease subunit HflK|uniref:protease modulator HflK n=1 Tax=Erythrobacter sp. TaxID=1042 RepID=UPI002B489699|nr:protease modulator HflK [Erythrobacter sp.]WRH69910.1 MAG: protease modulator HflK [Erythrobacter sp.]